MKNKAFFWTVAAICMAVNALMACGTIKYPSCGAMHYRMTDGAQCQECVDKDGSDYTHCFKAEVP